MISFEFGGASHEFDVTWSMVAKIADKVGDPHRILAAGGEMGLIDAVRIVSICTGIPENTLGPFAMKEGAQDIYTVAAQILLETVPQADDTPDVEGKKT